MPRGAESGAASDGLGISVSIDEAAVRALALALRRLPLDISRQMQQPVRAIGDDLQRTMRGIITRKGSGPTRSAVAAGVTARAYFAPGRWGLNVASAGPAPMARLLNTKRWRHPVYGNRHVWRNQYGTPFFGNTIAKYEPKFREAVQQGLAEAIKRMGR